jgi:membrane-bound ClpP family serine protease
MWQKWVGRGLIAVDAIVLAVCAFLQAPVTWWQPIMIALTGLVNILIGLFPPKA